MKIKVSEATPLQLDWMVAKAEGKVEQGVYGTPQLWNTGLHLHYCGAFLGSSYDPSTDWSQGGPIIEREKIGTQPIYQGYVVSHWSAVQELGEGRHNGPTPLIAAMRCYVASKMGDEVEVPDGL